MKPGPFHMTHDEVAYLAPTVVTDNVRAAVVRSDSADHWLAIDLKGGSGCPVKWWMSPTKAGAIACALWHLRD
jgi:hypothetical protein